MLVIVAQVVGQLTSGLLTLGDDWGNLGYTPVDFLVLLLLRPSRFDADAIHEPDGLRLLMALSRDFGVKCVFRSKLSGPAWDREVEVGIM